MTQSHSRLAAAFTAIIVTASMMAISGQQAPSSPTPDARTGTGVIMGRVLDAETGTPLDGAVATVNIGFGSYGPIFASVRTNDDGVFVFRDLPAGQWTIGALRPGHESTNGRRVPVELGEGARVLNVLVRLRPYGSIAGRVADETGAAVVGATVRLATRSVRGVWSASLTTTTDDRGAYRFTRLAANDYLVLMHSVTGAITTDSSTPAELRTLLSGTRLPPDGAGLLRLRNSLISIAGASVPPFQGDNGELMVYPSTYAPSTRRQADARVVTIRNGNSVDNVDIRLSPVPALRVSGTVVATEPGRVSSLNLRLISSATGIVGDDLTAMTAGTNASGRFTFPLVASGEYTLQTYQVQGASADAPTDTVQVETGTQSLTVPSQTPSSAQRNLSTTPSVWAKSTVNVGNEDIENLTVSLRRGYRISGRFQFDGTSKQPTTYFAGGLSPADGAWVGESLPILADADLSFSSPEFRPRRYFYRQVTPAPWLLRSAMLNGRDIADEPIDLTENLSGLLVTFTDRPAKLSGTVEQTAAMKLMSSLVIAFSANRAHWTTATSRRTVTATTKPDGSYAMPALPAGEYFVVALEDSTSTTWNDPAVLAELATSAVRVTLVEGQTAQQGLRAVSQPRPKIATNSAATIESIAPSLQTSGPFVDDADADQIRDATPKAMAPATPTLSGTVIDAGTRAPLRAAIVTVRGSDGAYSTVTDLKGHFEFVGITAGQYKLSATKLAYLTCEWGAKRPGRPGVSLALKSAAQQSLTLEMTHAGSIAGTITDEKGRPLYAQGVSVLVRQVSPAGEVSLRGAPGATPLQFDTDDRGQYRVFGLGPGDYVISVSPAGVNAITAGPATTAADIAFARGTPGRSTESGTAVRTPPPTVMYAPLFYPGTPDSSQARVITLAPGEQRDDINVQMRLVPVHSLAATVTTSAGIPSAKARVTLFPNRAYPPTSVTDGVPDVFSVGGSVRIATGADGRFIIRGLSPGPYTVFVRGSESGSGPQTSWAISNVTIADHDVDDLHMSLHAGLSASGAIRFLEDPPADMTRMRVNIESMGSSLLSVTAPGIAVDDKRQFSVASLVPGTYAFTASGLPAPWSLKAAVLDGHDISDDGLPLATNATGIELIFTNKPSELAGTFSDAAGQPTTDYFVIVFPTGRQYWRTGSRRIMAMRPATDGSFSFKNLPAGDYRMAAVTDVENNEWFDARFLERLVGTSIAFTLADGEHKRQDIKIGGKLSRT